MDTGKRLSLVKLKIVSYCVIPILKLNTNWASVNNYLK